LSETDFFRATLSAILQKMTHADTAKSDAIGAGSLLRRANTPCLFLLMVMCGCAVPPAKVRVTAPPEGRLSQVGIASWYGPGFHGKATTSGAIYNQYEFTAAHQTLPLGTRVMVTNLETGSATEVTINDRGPFAKNRIIDLSYSAAEAIHMIGPGTALVRVDIIDSPRPLQAIRGSLDYTLQLGSFSQLENAHQLRDRVANSFTDVSIALLQSKDTTYYRVQLGSFTNRADAEARARQVAQAGYSVIVMEK
jgi:rare lipoprotein A